MDDRRFDAIARSLGTTRSRRGALGLLAGAAGLGLAGADAKRRHKGKKGKQAKPATVSAVCAAAGSKACTLAQAKPGAVLKDCDYAAADLSGKALNATNLSKASLAGANLSGANLAGANLASACLAGADLSGANLRGTSLSGADLTGANICGADLRGSNVKPAQLATATLCCATILPDNKPAGCPAGTACCDGAHCVDTQNDPANCGACGNSCPTAHPTCSGGACVGCDPGYEYLNGGCFKIVNTFELQIECADNGCDGYGSISGSGNYLCSSVPSNAVSCTETPGCPTGQACQLDLNACLVPCPPPF